MSDSYFKKILKYEIQWCKTMGYFNPYVDPFNDFISKKIPDFDGQAYNRYPKYQFVYDKLWVMKSQGLLCGRLEKLNENSNIKLPIFIKPRWGHKTASSKNCYKIKSWDDLNKYKHIPELMWSEFIDDNECMTDYILLNGTIVYQITYKYSPEQTGYIETWKYISPDNKPLPNITEWVQLHLSGFTGAVNVQYRGDKIIEVGLRLARGGAYILSTKNKYLIQNINNVVERNHWDYGLENKMKYDSYYSFKCYTTAPVFFFFPQTTIDYIMKSYDCMPFYEYYFEPSGNDGSVFIQFMHKDFKVGMKCKSHLESAITYSQYIFIILFFTSLILININKYLGIFLLIMIGLLYNTRFLNPFSVSYNQFKIMKLKYLS